MKDFRVFYAGDPSGVMQLSAVDAQEAAYLFFSNEPRKGSIFVEQRGLLRETVVTYSELSVRFPDAPAIFATFEGPKGVISDALVRDRSFTKKFEDDRVVLLNRSMRRFIFTIAGTFVVVFWLVSLFLK